MLMNYSIKHRKPFEIKRIIVNHEIKSTSINRNKPYTVSTMTRCKICSNGINSTYIREGKKSLWRKIGHYCIVCDIYYNLKSQVYSKRNRK